MRSRRSGGSVNWVLLVSGRFSVSETIIPKPGAFSYPFSTPPLSPFRWIGGKKSIRGYPMGGSKLQTRKRVLSVATMPLAVFAIVAGIITACASSEGSSRPQPQDTETRIAQAVAATVEVQSRTAQTVAATDTPSQPTAKHNPTSTLLPPPPQIVTDSMMAYTECVLNFASGSLSRPRINDFKALPYMSELLSPGAMVSREILIRYQNEYLLDTLHNMSEICGLQVYSTEYIESQQQEYEILEASNAIIGTGHGVSKLPGAADIRTLPQQSSVVPGTIRTPDGRLAPRLRCKGAEVGHPRCTRRHQLLATSFPLPARACS